MSWEGPMHASLQLPDGCQTPSFSYPHCLDCPRSTCIYDTPPTAVTTVRRAERDAEIQQAVGTTRELAAMFGVSVRTVHRARARVHT